MPIQNAQRAPRRRRCSEVKLAAQQLERAGECFRRVRWIELEPEAHALDDDGDLVAVDAALVRLREVAERPARVVELRFFGGLSPESVSEVLGVSLSTVEREWRYARAWLARELEQGAR